MTIEAMLGRISRNMIRRGRSPVTTTAATKSLPRMDSACDRSTRAEPAQPVIVEHQDDGAETRWQEGGEDDEQRQAGEQQEHVGGRDSASSMRLPKYADARPTRMPIEGGGEADGESDEQRTAGALDGEGEHVLSFGRGAEPVLGRRFQRGHRGDPRRVSGERAAGASRSTAQMNTSITAMPSMAFLLVASPWTKLRLGLRGSVVGRRCAERGPVLYRIGSVADMMTSSSRFS